MYVSKRVYFCCIYLQMNDDDPICTHTYIDANSHIILSLYLYLCLYSYAHIYERNMRAHMHTRTCTHTLNRPHCPHTYISELWVVQHLHPLFLGNFSVVIIIQQFEELFYVCIDRVLVLEALAHHYFDLLHFRTAALVRVCMSTCVCA